MRAWICRPFTVLDAMILIGAAAVALAWTRLGLNELKYDDHAHKTHLLYWFLHDLAKRIYLGLPFATLGSATILALRFRKPRPRGLCLLRQPGLVACLAVVLTMTINLFDFVAGYGLVHLESAPRSWSLFFESLHNTIWPQWFEWTPRTSMAVAMAWVTLAMTGAWRSERGWIDRMGRVLGVFWIAIIPIMWFNN